MLLLTALGLFFLVTVLYLPTLRGGFVYDSISQVVYSDYIHTPAHWGDVLTLRVVGQDKLDRNRPLHLASLMVDAAVWGKDPFGFRLTSVLLHALNAALLFLFMAVVWRSQTVAGGDGGATGSVAAACSPAIVPLAAGFGAVFFALHPAVVEAVAEPSNREDLLVLLPMLGGLVAIAVPLPSRLALNAVLMVCCLAAVLAKESGLAVPLVFAAACRLLGDGRRCWPGVTAGLLAALAFLAASYVLRPSGSLIFAHQPAPLAPDWMSLLAVQARIWTLQLWQIVWPWNLSAHYPPESLAGIPPSLAVFVLLAFAAVSVALWRADRLAALGLAVGVLCLLPASNFAAQYHPIADRYLYAPLAGLGMVLAALLGRLRVGYPSRRAGVALAGVSLLLLTFEYAANVRRQIIWQQPATLWSDVLRQYPRSSQAQVGLANVHWRAGDFPKARDFAAQAVSSSGGRWADAWALRAVCEWQTGHREQASLSFASARRASRAYAGIESVSAALFFSPEQLQVLAEIFASDPR